MPRQPRPLEADLPPAVQDELGQLGDGTLNQHGSEWRQIPPGGKAYFQHELGVVPANVDVSVATTGDGSNEKDAAFISSVDKSNSGVNVTNNHAHSALWFRVRAR